jgi:hypothetical protein
VMKPSPWPSGIMWDLGFPGVIPLFLFYKSMALGTDRERKLGCANRLGSPRTSKVGRIGTNCLDREQP